MKSRFFRSWLVLAGCLALFASGLANEVVGAVDSGTIQEHKFTTKYAYYDEKPWTGLVKTCTDPAGHVTTYTYDREGRLTKVVYGDGKTVEHAYDKLGRRTAMKDWTGTTRYEHDTLNRLIRVNQSNGLWLKFEYDWLHRITAIITPGDTPRPGEGWRVQYAYDVLGRLVQLTSPAGRFSWKHDAQQGTVTRRMPNGVVSTFSYSVDGALLSVRHERENTVTNAKQGQQGGRRILLADFSYAYYPDGNVSSETMTTDKGKQVTGYRYDKVSRLIEVTMPDGKKIAYSYDAMGNRLTQTGPAGVTEYAYDQWDQIERAGEEKFGHDRLGNVAWREGHSDKTTYVYDCQNHMVGVRSARGAVEYTYSGDGFLVARRAGGEDVEYLVLPLGQENRFLVTQSRDSAATRYVLSDRPLCGVRDKSCEFYLEDRLGSVRLVVDNQGEPIRSITYDAFGVFAPTVGVSVSDPLYVGLPYDSDALLFLTHARAYEPQLGRFLQSEPKRRIPTEQQTDLCLYAYCGNDPQNRVDRNGLEPKRVSQTDSIVSGLLGSSDVEAQWQYRVLTARANVAYAYGRTGLDAMGLFMGGAEGAVLAVGQGVLDYTEGTSVGEIAAQAGLERSIDTLGRDKFLVPVGARFEGQYLVVTLQQMQNQKWVIRGARGAGTVMTASGLFGSIGRVFDAHHRLEDSLKPLRMVQFVDTWKGDAFSGSHFQGVVDKTYTHLGGPTEGYEPGVTSRRVEVTVKGSSVEWTVPFRSSGGKKEVLLSADGHSAWVESPSDLSGPELGRWYQASLERYRTQQAVAREIRAKWGEIGHTQSPNPPKETSLGEKASSTPVIAVQMKFPARTPGEASKENRESQDYVVERQPPWSKIAKKGSDATVWVYDGADHDTQEIVDAVAAKAAELGVMAGETVVIGGDPDDAKLNEVKENLKKRGFRVDVVDCRGLSHEEAILKIGKRGHELGARAGALVRSRRRSLDGSSSYRRDLPDGSPTPALLLGEEPRPDDWTELATNPRRRAPRRWLPLYPWWWDGGPTPPPVVMDPYDDGGDGNDNEPPDNGNGPGGNDNFKKSGTEQGKSKEQGERKKPDENKEQGKSKEETHQKYKEGEIVATGVSEEGRPYIVVIVNGRRQVIWIPWRIYRQIKGQNVTVEMRQVGSITVVIIYVNGKPVWEVHIGPGGHIIWQGPPGESPPKEQPPASETSVTPAVADPGWSYPSGGQRRSRFFWRGGQGSGALTTAATRVGGVRLDKAAEVLGQIGHVAALTYDPGSRQLVLLGEKGKTALPAMRLDDLAVVLRSIYVEGVDPFVSIDPKAGDVYGPKMNVVYSPGLAFTHAGRVMYHSDYKLKEYAAGGRGSKRLASEVAEWKCLAELEKELFPQGRQRDRRIWYRFWLKPGEITVKLAPDGKSLIFETATVHVETENMLLKDGRLERVENVKDPVAEEFARRFSKNYDRFAAEFPAYEEVRQLAQIVGLVKWMYEQGIEVDLSWIARHAAGTEATPLETDAVWAERAVQNESGSLAGQDMHFYFGGVTLAVNLRQRRLQESQGTPKDQQYVHQLQSLMEATRREPGKEVLELADGEDASQHAVTVPGVARRALGAYHTQVADLAITDGENSLALVRHYNSLFTEPTTFGRGWSLLLPRLLHRLPLQTEKPVQMVDQQGNTRILPVYFLTDDFGAFEEVFHPDPVMAKRGIVRYLSSGNQGIQQLNVLPQNEGFRVIFRSGQVWHFNQEGYLVSQIGQGRMLQYALQELPGKTHRVQSIVSTGEGLQPLRIVFEYNAQGRIVRAVGSDQSETRYGYDDRGNLVQVVAFGNAIAYRYDASHLLTTILKDNRLVESIGYDELGRLVALRGDGKESAYRFESRKDGRLAVIERNTSRSMVYDSQMRLVSIEDQGGQTEYEYHRNGLPKTVVLRDPSGLETKASCSEGGDSVRWHLPGGAAFDYALDPAGNVSSLDVNGELLGEFQYDPTTGEMQEAMFPTCRYSRLFDRKQLVQETIVPRSVLDASEPPLNLHYANGKLTKVAGPGSLSMDIEYRQGSIAAITTPRQKIWITDNGKVRKITTSEGRSQAIYQDVAGEIERIVATVADASREMQFRHGLPTAIRNYDGGMTRYEWDETTGLLASVMDPLEAKVSYRYQQDRQLPRLVAVTLPNQRSIELEYDRSGRILRVSE